MMDQTIKQIRRKWQTIVHGKMKVLIIILFIFFVNVTSAQWAGRINRQTGEIEHVNPDGNNQNIIKQNGNIEIDIYSKYSLVDYNDSALVHFNRMDVAPSADLKAAYSTFYDTIQYSDIDDSCDCIYNFGAETAQQGLLDLIDRNRTATAVNSPTFTAYEGFTGNGTTSYIKTNYSTDQDAVNYKLNSASLAVFVRTNNIVDNKYFAGVLGTASYFRILIRTASIQNTINGLSNFYISHGNDISGYTIITRVDASNVKYARNFNGYTNVADASSAIPDQADGIYVLALNNRGSAAGYSTNQVFGVAVCAQLSEVQAQVLARAWERFLDTFNKGIL